MFAGMAELADAQASGACGSNIVWVQIPSPADNREAAFKAASFFIMIYYSSKIAFTKESESNF